jgi:hypothetical protein
MAASRQQTETDTAREAMQAIAEELDLAIDEERGRFPQLLIDGRLTAIGGVIMSPTDLVLYSTDGGEHYFLYDRDYPKLLTALVRANMTR